MDCSILHLGLLTNITHKHSGGINERNQWRSMPWSQPTWYSMKIRILTTASGHLLLIWHQGIGWKIPQCHSPSPHSGITCSSSLKCDLEYQWQPWAFRRLLKCTFWQNTLKLPNCIEVVYLFVTVIFKRQPKYFLQRKQDLSYRAGTCYGSCLDLFLTVTARPYNPPR